MSVEENKAIIRDAFNRMGPDQLSAVMDMTAEDFVDHNPPPGAVSGDREGVLQAFASLFKAFPDLALEVTHIIGEGDLVAVRAVSRGTNSGELQGRPATGKSIEMTGTHIFRLANGKIAEHWADQDVMGMMMQLGLAPAPGS